MSSQLTKSIRRTLRVTTCRLTEHIFTLHAYISSDRGQIRCLRCGLIRDVGSPDYPSSP